jgi:hypothetical protein
MERVTTVVELLAVTPPLSIAGNGFFRPVMQVFLNL